MIDGLIDRLNRLFDRLYLNEKSRLNSRFFDNRLIDCLIDRMINEKRSSNLRYITRYRSISLLCRDRMKMTMKLTSFQVFQILSHFEPRFFDRVFLTYRCVKLFCLCVMIGLRQELAWIIACTKLASLIDLALY